ncbi:MAG: GTP-binding protein [Actinomycetota bacterium]
MTDTSVPVRFDFKIIVAGAFAVGKTTLIATISDEQVVGTEVGTSGAEASVKETTTVGMEYGTFAVGGDDVEVELNLFGVPGQPRFSFMWDIVSQGMDALLLLVDAQRPETWTEALGVGRHFRRQRHVPVVVAINRTDDVDAAVAAIQAEVPIEGAHYVTCDPRDTESARAAVIEVLYLLLDQLEDDEGETGDG